MKELHELADDKRKKAETLAQLLDKNAFELAADPTRRGRLRRSASRKCRT